MSEVSSIPGKPAPYEVRPSAISFGEGPPQVVIYIEHLAEALAYILANKIVSIEVDTKSPHTRPLQLDFGFLKELPNLSGLECRMNISTKTDLEPLYQIHELRQLGWPGRTSPPIDLSNFPNLEYLSLRHQPSTRGWEKLTKLRVLRLSVTGSNDLEFLSNLKSLAKLEISDSSIESLAGIERLPKLERLDIFVTPKLTDISSIPKCKSLRFLYVEKAKRLTDYSPLAESTSIESLKLVTPIDSVEFVPHMKSLKILLFNDINSNDLSPLLQAKSLKQLDFYPEKRSYSHTLAEIKQSLGIP